MIKSDTVVGLCVLVTGLSLWLVVIPNGTESIDTDWVEPDTLPKLLAWMLIALGTILALRPTDHVLKARRELAKFGLFFGILIAGLWAISVFGFIYASPVLVAVLMLASGERRPHWLIAGVAGIPGTIWFVIVYLLDRALPGGEFG